MIVAADFADRRLAHAGFHRGFSFAVRLRTRSHVAFRVT